MPGSTIRLFSQRELIHLADNKVDSLRRITDHSRWLLVEFLLPGMQLHQIPALQGNKTKKRIGRGGKLGTYSGRGIKGQKSRSGRKLRPEWRDALKSIPKKRGYKFNSYKTKPVVLNLSILSKVFKDGEIVTAKSLEQKGLIEKVSGRLPEIKILGGGELSKKLSFKGLILSASAQEAIVKIKGTIS